MNGHLVLYDRALCTPPFGLTWWGLEAAERDPHGRFRYGVPPRTAVNLRSCSTCSPLSAAPVGWRCWHLKACYFRGGAEGEIRKENASGRSVRRRYRAPGQPAPRDEEPRRALAAEPRQAGVEVKRAVLFIMPSRGFQEEQRRRSQLGLEDVTKIATTFRSAIDVLWYARPFRRC